MRLIRPLRHRIQRLHGLTDGWTSPSAQTEVGLSIKVQIREPVRLNLGSRTRQSAGSRHSGECGYPKDRVRAARILANAATPKTECGQPAFWRMRLPQRQNAGSPHSGECGYPKYKALTLH